MFSFGFSSQRAAYSYLAPQPPKLRKTDRCKNRRRETETRTTHRSGASSALSFRVSYDLEIVSSMFSRRFAITVQAANCAVSQVGSRGDEPMESKFLGTGGIAHGIVRGPNARIPVKTWTSSAWGSRDTVSLNPCVRRSSVSIRRQQHPFSPAYAPLRHKSDRSRARGPVRAYSYELDARHTFHDRVHRTSTCPAAGTFVSKTCTYFVDKPLPRYRHVLLASLH